MTGRTRSARFQPKWLRAAVLLAVLFGVACAAHAADKDPLRPPDTSSPRATLEGFIETTDHMYSQLTEVLADYADSGRLYLSPAERRMQQGVFKDAPRAIRFLDTSSIPPVLRDTVSVECLIQLKEILDRIDIPPFADIPDREAMARMSAKRWRLPDTEIDIVLMESGPRAGEYLFSAATIDRIPEFFDRVKDLPYKPGPGKQLADIYSSLTRGGSSTIYDAFLTSPIGLSYVIPPRWMLNVPTWMKTRIAAVATWQWLGLLLGLLIGAFIIIAGHRLARRHPDDPVDAPSGRWRTLLLPLSIVLVAGLFVPLLNALLRIGGGPRVVVAYTSTAATFLGAAWLAVVAAVVLGEALVTSEHLTPRSLDSQLIRLGTRLIGLVVAVVILIQGGDELGFPAYSVLAGLGVGGLAVALAAQTTIANLIGSLLITMEKPFRVGHSVRIGTSEGTVEDVGFRSTRIRTPDSTVVTIPSSSVVNTTVENLSLRTKRRQRIMVKVAQDTPRKKIEDLIARIRQLIADNPLVEEGTCRVHLNSFGDSSLDIQVQFNLRVDDAASEAQEREAVLLQIMDIVEQAGVQFA